MDDKPLAGILTILLAAPLVFLCCGGAVFIVPIASGLAGWLGGFDIISAILLGLAIAGLIVGARMWLRRNAGFSSFSIKGE